MNRINLRLNNGCYCSEACRDVLTNFKGDFRLSLYTDENNERLLDALSKFHAIPEANIILANGSGPLLMRGLPMLVENRIRSSIVRTARHFAFGDGCPLVTPEMTYFKVPLGGRRKGLRIHFVKSVERDGRFLVDLAGLDATLARRPAVVYIATPSNPNGTVVFDRNAMLEIIARRSDSLFWMDEAYVELLEPSLASEVELIRHVPKFENLIVSRSFSFAYGLAGARIGFAAAPEWAAKILASKESTYRLGVLQEELALAALKSSKEHLAFITKYMRTEREKIEAALSSFEGIQVFASDTHQVLGRFTDERQGKLLADGLAAHGISIRHFENEAKSVMPKLASFFRLCVGRPEENQAFIDRLGDVLGKRSEAPHALRAVS